MFEVIDHLAAHFVLRVTRCPILRVLFSQLLSHGGASSRLVPLVDVRDLVTKSGKLDPITHRVPLEVEHGVNRLNLDPPRPGSQCFSDRVGIVAIPDYELVAVLDVGVLEGDLADGAAEHRISRRRRLVFPSLVPFVLASLQGGQVLLHLKRVQMLRELVRRRVLQEVVRWELHRIGWVDR